MITVEETEKRENQKGKGQEALMMDLHPRKVKDIAGN